MAAEQYEQRSLSWVLEGASEGGGEDVACFVSPNRPSSHMKDIRRCIRSIYGRLPGLPYGIHPRFAVHFIVGSQVVLPLVFPPVRDGETVLKTEKDRRLNSIGFPLIDSIYV